MYLSLGYESKALLKISLKLSVADICSFLSVHNQLIFMNVDSVVHKYCPAEKI